MSKSFCNLVDSTQNQLGVTKGNTKGDGKVDKNIDFSDDDVKTNNTIKHDVKWETGVIENGNVLHSPNKIGTL